MFYFLNDALFVVDKMKIVGLPKKAVKYIDNNSMFIKGNSVGCKRSDGTLNIKARMYKKELVNTETVLMFEYVLKNGIAKTKVQKSVKDYIFISLMTPEGKEIKWSNKEINTYITELS